MTATMNITITAIMAQAIDPMATFVVCADACAFGCGQQPMPVAADPDSLPMP